MSSGNTTRESSSDDLYAGAVIEPHDLSTTSASPDVVSTSEELTDETPSSPPKLLRNPGINRGIREKSVYHDAIIGECYDLLEKKQRAIDLGSFGEVQLVDVYPRLAPIGYNGEYAIARSARTSYGNGLKSPKADDALVKYLLRNRHTSPSEFVSATFRLKVPIFVARQILRHRTASVNEFSMRYAEPEEKYYIPDVFRRQDSVNKQSSHGEFEDARFQKKMEDAYETCLETYRSLIENGVCREIARSVLPVGMFTVFYFKMDLHNLTHFLRLRTDAHTQLETRKIAEAMLQLMRPVVPAFFDQFDEDRQALYLTKDEQHVLQKVIDGCDIATAFEDLGIKSKSARVACEKKIVSILGESV